MTSINKIESTLKITIGDRHLYDGKYDTTSNRYYYYKNDYYIVEIDADRWMVASDCRRTRMLLSEKVWGVVDYRQVATIPIS
jgi:hypothetical protein